MYHQQPIYDGRSSRQTLNKMKVTGEGRVSVQPDQAEVTLGVSTEDQQLRIAQEENAQSIEQIKHALNQIGIADQDIQTADYSIFPQYDFIEGKQIFRTYKVNHTLSITVQNLENTGLVVDTAVKNGANNVTGIKFDVADSNKFNQLALTLAIANASEKAETIARKLGVQYIKTPVLLNEMPLSQTGPIPFQTTEFVKSAATTPIQPGTMEIKSHISAEFIYFING